MRKMIEAEQLHARILSRLDMTRDMEDEELTELIYEVLQEASQEEYLPLDQKTMLGKELFNAFRKLDPVSYTHLTLPTNREV